MKKISNEGNNKMREKNERNGITEKRALSN